MITIHEQHAMRLEDEAAKQDHVFGSGSNLLASALQAGARALRQVGRGSVPASGTCNSMDEPCAKEKLSHSEDVHAPQAEPIADRMPELPQCPSCGCVGEATVRWEEDSVPFLRHASNIHDTVSVTARVPVWKCNACEFQWTDGVGEGIRDAAVKEAREALLVSQDRPQE